MTAAHTVLDLFEQRVNQSSTRPAIRRVVDGSWQPISWREWWEVSERIAAGLTDAGIEPGDRVAVLCGTRAEWLFCDIAIQMLGAVTVPVYPSLNPELVAHVLGDSEARAAIVADPSQLDKVVRVRDRLPELQAVVWIDPEAVRTTPDFDGRRNVRLLDVVEESDPWNRSLESLAASGRRRLADDALSVARLRQNIEPDDVATIVYTSGTTAEPRGVMLTHRNIVAQLDALRRLELFDGDDVQFLFLPLAHIFARVLYLAAVSYGIETALGGDIRRLAVEMQQVRPTFFAAVPQIFERVRTKIERGAGSGGEIRERFFRVAERLGRESDRAMEKLGEEGVLERIGRRVLRDVKPKKARQLFGGRVRFAISGGAPLSVDTARFFGAFGLQVLEGYGLTETTAVATVNLPGDSREGSVGRPLPGVDITIDEDGEILIRGETVSPGYWRDPELTSASRDDDGWFCTGDLGVFDRDGYLSITGRKKEIIVTAGGKNIPPVPIEAALEAIPIVERAYVHGDLRPHIVALLSLDADAVTDWAREHDVSVDEALEDARLLEALDQAVTRVNSSSPSHADVRRWGLAKDPFSEENDEVTATLKLRRDVIAKRRADEIAALYESDAPRTQES